MVTVIIVNWNSGNLLRQCLRDLSRQDLFPSRIMVVDNDSSDGSTEGLDEICDVEIYPTGSNLGFAAGNNYALSLVDTEYVALLNPDAFPEPSWLDRLVAVAQDNPDVAAFGSRQMMHEDSGLVDGMGDVYHISGLAWRAGHGYPAGPIESLPFEIFTSCAGAALYRTNAIRAAGGFDEDFFCYVEDVDLGFRLRLFGYKALLVPNAVVYHVGSATTGGRHSEFSVYYGHRNLVWAFVKNMPGWLLWACLPLHIAMNIASVLWFSVKGQGSVILRAKLDAFCGLAAMWRKRKLLQQQKAVSSGEIWRLLDKRLWLSKRRW